MNKIISLLFPIFLFSQVIKFAPLPIDTVNNLYDKYKPMLNYLSKNTNDTYQFIYIPSYKKLLKSFKEGKVDMIILGALPYLRLKSNFKSATPIMTFLNKYKKAYYYCQIITNDKDIKSLKDINKNTKIFLTNKLSTCGYLMTEYMFQKYNLNLDNYKYKYVGTHTDVVFNVSLHNRSIGDVKSSIAKEYNHYIKVIDRSIKIPGFSLIINTNKISKNKMDKIRNLLANFTKINMIITPKDLYRPIENILKKVRVK